MATRLAIVLAAGKGTRMKSDLPKVLFPACGRPLIDYVIDALEAAHVERIVVVVGYRAEDVKASLIARRGVEFALQAEQLGTGHAVQVCQPNLAGYDGPALIVTGDSPMLRSKTVERLFQEYEATKPACLLGTLVRSDPQGLGRIVRDATGNFEGIAEEKDATEAQRKITEVNMSTYIFHTPDLLSSLGQLRNTNNQREYYLTDCPGILRKAGRDVRALPILEPCEALSVNRPEELAAVEAEMRRLKMA